MVLVISKENHKKADTAVIVIHDIAEFQLVINHVINPY